MTSKKILSCILVASMLTGAIPVNMIASATDPPTTVTITPGTDEAKTGTGQLTITLKIEADITPTVTLTADNVTIAALTYNGTAQSPVLKYGDTTLVKDTDYTVDAASTASATDAGTYTIKVNGINNYAGENVELSWTINKKAVTITADSDSKTYDGSALTNSGFTASDLETGDTHTFTVAMSESRLTAWLLPQAQQQRLATTLLRLRTAL